MSYLYYLARVITLCLCVLSYNSITVCAEPSDVLPPISGVQQVLNTPPDEVIPEGEEGVRGQVLTQEGEVIGSLEDFLIEPAEGCIAYGVVAPLKETNSDSFTIIPWALMHMNPEDSAMSNFRFQGKRDLLPGAPQISQTQWLTSPIAEWLEPVAQYWTKQGVHLCPDSPPEKIQMTKASDVVGTDILAGNGHPMGTIRELILDSEKGIVTSVVVVQKDLSRSVQHVFFTLPWNALYLNTQQHMVIVYLESATIRPIGYSAPADQRERLFGQTKGKEFDHGTL